MTQFKDFNTPWIAQEELKEANTGAWVFLGTLQAAPVHIVYDNLADVETEISTDGGNTTWKTFDSREALVLDSNLGCPPQGTSYWARGASGSFSIAYHSLRSY